MCVAAARTRRARCVGIELREAAALGAAAAVQAAGVSSLATVVHGNALELDLSSATVVFLYLLPRGNARIAAKLLAELRPGTRVVCHMFRMHAEWEARLRDTHAVQSCRAGGVDTSAFTKLFLYVT